MGHRVLFPSSVAFEQEVATRLHADFPPGVDCPFVHDVYVGEEHIDVLTVVPHGIFAIECKWIHACVVVPQAADVSTRGGIAVNPRILLPRGQSRAIVVHPDYLSASISLMRAELAHKVAQALVLALGGTVDGTWLTHNLRQQAISRLPPPQTRGGFQLQIGWEW
jgi:Nuclease-related domain